MKQYIRDALSFIPFVTPLMLNSNRRMDPSACFRILCADVGSSWTVALTYWHPFFQRPNSQKTFSVKILKKIISLFLDLFFFVNFYQNPLVCLQMNLKNLIQKVIIQKAAAIYPISNVALSYSIYTSKCAAPTARFSLSLWLSNTLVSQHLLLSHTNAQHLSTFLCLMPLLPTAQ